MRKQTYAGLRPVDRQVVVITGASSGIGRATALAFAERGAAVVLVARRAEALEELAREIERKGGRALAAPADVTIEAEVEAVARRAVDELGRIDTWVNCAAVYVQGLVDDLSVEEYRRVLEVDVIGYIIGARAALRVMRRQGAGVIVFVSSIVGKRGAPYASAYSTAKAALDGFAESLRAELWGSGVHVSTIYVPSVDTPIYENARGKFGTRPKPAPPIRRAEWPARIIVELAERPRPQRMFGWFRHFYVGMNEISPALSDWFLHQTADFTRSDIPSTRDNLFDLSPGPPVVSVGLADHGVLGFTLGDIARVLPRATAAAAAMLGTATSVAMVRLVRPNRRVSLEVFCAVVLGRAARQLWQRGSERSPPDSAPSARFRRVAPFRS